MLQTKRPAFVMAQASGFKATLLLPYLAPFQIGWHTRLFEVVWMIDNRRLLAQLCVNSFTRLILSEKGPIVASDNS